MGYGRTRAFPHDHDIVLQRCDGNYAGVRYNQRKELREHSEMVAKYRRGMFDSANANDLALNTWSAAPLKANWIRATYITHSPIAYLYTFSRTQHANEDVEKMILGNKCDVAEKRVVAKERGEAVSKQCHKNKNYYGCENNWCDESPFIANRLPVSMAFDLWRHLPRPI